MIEILMPRLSDSMEEGTILGWLVEPGQEVAEGDELVEIETDKANMIFEADHSGLVHPVAKEGDSLPVGAPIAQLLDPGEEPATGDSAGTSPSSPAEDEEDEGEAGGHLSHTGPPPAESSAPSESDEGPSRTGRVRASPLARRIAEERGIDLAGLEGSGPGARIVKADVERAEGDQVRSTTDSSAGANAGEASAETAKGTVEIVELNRLQQTVSRRMSESKATVPHFYLTTDIDMSNCVAARAGLKASAPEGTKPPSFNDMVIKACAIALGEFPRANGGYRDGRIELYSRINIGVAVAAENSLVVPVIPDADRKGLNEIAAKARELAGKVRDGSITPPELSGGTFTVSNLGMFGVTAFDAVINSPQAGILAVGAIEARPVVREGEIVPASMMSVTLSCDHRILYGADGAQFLARIRAILEQPLSLAL